MPYKLMEKTAAAQFNLFCCYYCCCYQEETMNVTFVACLFVCLFSLSLCAYVCALIFKICQPFFYYLFSWYLQSGFSTFPPHLLLYSKNIDHGVLCGKSKPKIIKPNNFSFERLALFLLLLLRRRRLSLSLSILLTRLFWCTTVKKKLCCERALFVLVDENGRVDALMRTWNE